MTARIACEHMTAQALKAWSDSVDRASRLPAEPGWETKAAAHAEIFCLLADAACAADAAGGQAAAAQHARARRSRHEIADLVRHGCPPLLALRIVR